MTDESLGDRVVTKVLRKKGGEIVWENVKNAPSAGIGYLT
jgi:hypothetical protein